MDTPQMIYTLIPEVMKDIGAVGKDKYNQQQGFKFRGIDDVMNTIKPILTKHQIFTVPEVIEQTREVKVTQKGGDLRYSLLKMRFAFFAPDGSHVDAVTLGEGMDSGDKASNKAMAIAYKYALFQVFCIPTEEMGADDPDSSTPEETRPDGRKGSTVPPQTKETAFSLISKYCQKRGMSKEQFSLARKALVTGGTVQDVPGKDMTPEQARELIAAVEANFPPDKAS